MFVSLRRNDRDGAFTGIVAAGIRLGVLDDTWRKAAQGRNPAVTLFRRDGTVLTRIPAIDPATPVRFDADGWVMRAVASGQEGMLNTGVSPVDGTTRSFAWRAVTGFPDLIIAHGVEGHAALAAWRQNLVIYGSFAALASLALCLLALLARRRALELHTLNDNLERRVDERTAEIRLGEARVRMLAREVDHRAKNLLSVVQATLRLTPKDDARLYAKAVEGRVSALARAQTLLTEERWRGADLATLLQAELGPFMAPEHAQVSLDGPAVRLPARVVQPLAMALHELATNAVKHGALAVPGGRVAVSWTLDEEVLTLRWSERGGGVVAGPPTRQGFGSRLLEGVVKGQLGGRLDLSWETIGLSCTMDVPVDERAES